MAPRILIFSIAMGFDYSFYVKFIATWAPTFFGYIISVLVNVRNVRLDSGRYATKYYYFQTLEINIKFKIFLVEKKESFFPEKFTYVLRNGDMCDWFHDNIQLGQEYICSTQWIEINSEVCFHASTLRFLLSILF